MYRTKKPLYISIMGTMGSGKTTAAHLIANHFKFYLVEENFGENAFLSRFYADMSRWAFHSQTFFLMEKINQLLEIGQELSKCTLPLGKKTKKPISAYCRGVVQDTPIEQDVFSYAQALHQLGNMDDAEWKLYKKIYQSFEPYFLKPDLIVFLDTSIPTIEKRIEGRGRGYETKIPTSYLKLLDTLNREWLKDKQKQKTLTIHTDSLNIVTSKLAQQELLMQLTRALK